MAITFLHYLKCTEQASKFIFPDVHEVLSKLQLTLPPPPREFTTYLPHIESKCIRMQELSWALLP